MTGEQTPARPAKDSTADIAEHANAKPADARQSEGVHLDVHLNRDDAEHMLHDGVNQFYKLFARATRRWERVVYPGLVVMLLIAMLGFYHIFTLSRDMRIIAQRIDPDMNQHMTHMAKSIATMADRVAEMSTTMKTMSGQVSLMQKDMAVVARRMDAMSRLESIDTRMKHMNRNMQVLVGQMDSMRWSVHSMNRNVSKPLGMMNSFMPW